MKKKVIVLGSLNKDLVSYVNKHPNIGETISANKFVKFNGGKGANQALAIARLGVETKMLGAIGEDEFGKEIISSLQQEKVNINNVILKNTNTGLAVIIVDSNSSNSIIVHGGANTLVNIEDVKTWKPIIKKNNIFVTQLENNPEVVLEGLKIAKQNNLTTILTPAPASGYNHNLLEFADILTPNEHEFKTIFGVECTKENFEIICKKHNEKKIIVTMGKKGVMYLENNTPTLLPIKKVNAIDTTAAGDAFVGGFVYKLANNENIKNAIEFGIKVAAVSVTKEGAQSSLPKLEEVENFKWEKPN